MLNLSLDELKVIEKKRGIKGYKSMSEDDLTKLLNEPKTKLMDKFSKPKIKEI